MPSAGLQRRTVPFVGALALDGAIARKKLRKAARKARYEFTVKKEMMAEIKKIKADAVEKACEQKTEKCGSRSCKEMVNQHTTRKRKMLKPKTRGYRPGAR